MVPYKKMYLHLFNAVTDALVCMAEEKRDLAEKTLKDAQQWCEDVYCREDTGRKIKKR